MAVITTNECVGCADDSHPCLGDICPNRNVKHYICDKCKDETDILFEYDDYELCEHCLLEEVPKVGD